MYWAPVMLLVSALRQGRHPEATMEWLKRLCGAWRTTVNRWLNYFRDLFPKSYYYRRLSGSLMPSIGPAALPGALLDRFCQTAHEPEVALANCLRTLALGP